MRRTLGQGLAWLLALTLATAARAGPPLPSVVLVHGAFADGSSWSRVIPLLQKKGYRVTAVQLPLTSRRRGASSSASPATWCSWATPGAASS